MISDYDILRNSNALYCNCSKIVGSFGSHCEYQMVIGNGTMSFDDVIEMTLSNKFPRDASELVDKDDISCFNLMKNCTTFSGLCLDWRQVCDGIIDCINEEDEKQCIEMELSECEVDKEYRCRNGHCIPLRFSFDLTFDCLDFYDEKEIEQKSLNCYRSSSVDCDEHVCGLARFSCGDGQCFPDIYTFDDLCQNERSYFLFENLFKFDDKQTILSQKCWKSLIRFFQISLELTIFIDLDSSCYLRDYSIFPTKPFVYPAVYFVHKHVYDIFPLETFLCFNKSMYAINVFHEEKLLDGYFCTQFNGFFPSIDDRSYFEAMVRVVHRIQILFSPYVRETINVTSSLLNEKLYECSVNFYISQYRLVDGYDDCNPKANPDELQLIKSCNVHPLMQRYKCLVDTTRACIPRRQLNDGHIECPHGDDEVFAIDCTNEYDCQYFRDVNIKEQFPVTYDELCNGKQLLKITDKEDQNRNDTDETDCEDWPSNSRNIRCDGQWNKNNGSDELNCENTTTYFYTKNIAHCSIDEHYCLDMNTGKLNCLPSYRANDGQIDCLFATDERLKIQYFFKSEISEGISQKGICRHKQGKKPQTVREELLCDRVLNCPQGDDELWCWWHTNSSCRNEQFTCQNGTCINRKTQRCNGQIDCDQGEDEWMCDFFQCRGNKKEDCITEWKTLNDTLFPLLHRPPPTIFYCNRGILLRSFDNKENICLCPPAYYGQRCQFQNRRISISFRLETYTTVTYVIVFYLLDQDEFILNHESFIHLPSERILDKYLVYLIYPRYLSNSVPTYVRVEVFEDINNNPLEFKLVWLFPIQFPFLPVNRIASLLDLRNESSIKFILPHGKCFNYENRNQLFCK
jgi:hypothetical protein